MSQYIGKTIALISNTDNRYVGLLESIDSEKGVVTLRQVRCFGTEGRKGWGPQEIYPNHNVYDSVAFNGNDVKDLNILDVPLEQVQPVVAPQAVAGEQSVPRPQVPAAVAGYGVYAPEEQQGKPQPSQQEHPEERKVENERVERKSRNGGAGKALPDAEFDFESNNAKFRKEDMSKEEELEKEKSASKTDEVFYDKKSSFFDSISSSAVEDSNSAKWQEERQVNMDTFGQARVRPRRGDYRGRGRGRGGRGRGGRGNYRGNRDGFSNDGNTNTFRQNGSSEQIEF